MAPGFERAELPGRCVCRLNTACTTHRLQCTAALWKQRVHILSYLFLQGRTRAVPLMADAPRDPKTGKVTSYLALGLTAGIKLKTLEQHAATCSAALEDVDSQEEEAPAATIFTLTTACVFSERLLE